jgi:penicillin-binding protein 2
VESGTAHSCAIPSIQMCGKTGTAQNPHGENHSLFAGYAPFENPKIAIAVIVENGGYGATYAAPIVSLMVEKYINDTIETSRQNMEKRMFDADLLNTGNYGKKPEIIE